MGHFNVEDWCANLGTVLTDLMETARLRSTFGFPGRIPTADGTSPEDANLIARANILQFAECARQFPEWRSRFHSARKEVSEDRVEAVCSVLELHPIISAHFETVGPPYIVFLGPPGGGGIGFPLDYLARDLVAPTCLIGAEETAKRLHRLLSEGEARELVGYQVTMFPGLHVGQRIDIGEGLFLASYEEVSAEYGPDPELEFIDDNHRHSIAPEEYDLLRRDPSRVGALVRGFRWGPAIGAHGTPTPVNIRPYYSVSGMDQLAFENEIETVRNILTIVTGAHQWHWTSYAVLEQWFGDLLGIYRRPSSRLYRRYRNDWWEHSEPTEGWADAFRTVVRQRHAYKGDAEKLDHAISRLAASYSRAGRFQVADSVADIAIALESMYRLDAPEITYKLRTRAAVFLESEPEKRKVIFDKAREFYSVRSNIVHVALPGERQREVMDAGRDIAKRTLLTLMKRGDTPDWDQFVLSAGAGGISP